MSKAKKVNLAAIKKQMEALQAAQAQEEQRIKENIAGGLTSDAVEKLGAYSEGGLKKIGSILSQYVDKAIKSYETDKAQKKAKAEAAKEAASEAVEEDIPDIADEADGATEAPKVKSNYGYNGNGYQQTNGTY
jgi:predicted AlkP superfamily phosphohydrolase/phosphomutase